MKQDYILIQIEASESNAGKMTPQDFAAGRLRMPANATAVTASPSRAEDMENLAANLPDGMFDADGDRLTYRGIPTAWLGDFVARVQKAAASLTVDNVASTGIRGLLGETGLQGPAYVVMEGSTMPLSLWLLGTIRFAARGDGYVIRQTLRYI